MSKNARGDMEEHRKTRSSSLHSAVAGLAAPAITFALSFVAISLCYSLFYLLYGGSQQELAARVEPFAERVNAFAPIAILAFTSGAGVWSARRAPHAYPRHAAIVGIASWLADTAIDAAWGYAPTLRTALALVEMLAAASAGVAVGWAIATPVQVLSRVRQALRAVRTPAEIATRIAATPGTGRRLTVRLWRAKGDDALRGGGSAPTVHELLLRDGVVVRREQLWALVPADTGEPGMLEVSSGLPWFFLRMRRSMWRAIGQAVGRVMDDLAALGDVRETALRAERERIGRDIHDTLAQDILSAVVHIEAAQLCATDPSSVGRHLGLALSSAREALSSARKIVWASRPESHDGVPLPDALGSLVEKWRARTEVAAALSCHGVPRRLDRAVEEALLRVVQEALHNVRKHANASDVVVTLSYTGSAVALDVKDDGAGFQPESARRGGFGLVSMREQVRGIGGELAVEARRGGGTTVAVIVPLREQSEALS